MGFVLFGGSFGEWVLGLVIWEGPKLFVGLFSLRVGVGVMVFVFLGVWGVSFVLGLWVLVGWSRLFLLLRRVSGVRDFVLGQSLLLLWAGLLSSLVVPCWVWFYGCSWWLLGVGVVLLGVVFVSWVRWLRLDRGKYILLVVFGVDFVEGVVVGDFDVGDFDVGDLLALSRRQRMSVMFEEFMLIQRDKYNLEKLDE